MNEMRPTKLTSAPEGFEYYRVCDHDGVCHVVRGMPEVQRLLEKTPGLTVTKIPRLKPSRSGGLVSHYHSLASKGGCPFPQNKSNVPVSWRKNEGNMARFSAC